jgi:hypothetical protein
MDENESLVPRPQLLSLSQTVEWLRARPDEELYKWLADGLAETASETARPHSQVDLDTFIVDVYREADPALQQRLGLALASLLESYVPSLTPNKNAAYLSGLLTLSSNFRNKRVRERLRRWLYVDMFKDWNYRGDNLLGVLIAATSVYDSDEEWLHHIRHILPTKPFFPQVARFVYRALMDTVGIECVELLPRILRAVNRADKKDQAGMAYLLLRSLKRFDQEPFVTKVSEVFNADWRVEMVFEDTLNLEECLKSALSDKPDRFYALTDDFDARIWTPVSRKWLSLDSERNQETFKAILQVCKPETVDQSIVGDALGALDFRGRHFLVVPRSHGHLREYFRFAAAAAGAG